MNSYSKLYLHLYILWQAWGMKAYGLDLRERIVSFVNAGGSKVEAARRFGVARKTVYNYLALVKAGALAPKASWGTWKKFAKKSFGPGGNVPVSVSFQKTVSNRKCESSPPWRNSRAASRSGPGPFCSTTERNGPNRPAKSGGSGIG